MVGFLARHYWSEARSFCVVSEVNGSQIAGEGWLILAQIASIHFAYLTHILLEKCYVVQFVPLLFSPMI